MIPKKYRREDPPEGVPHPGHLAWLMAPNIQALRDACAAAVEAMEAPDHQDKVKAIRRVLDAEARAQGCCRVDAKGKRIWMTPWEYEAFRAKNPGYRHDPEMHRRAAKKIPAAVRKARAKAGGEASKK